MKDLPTPGTTFTARKEKILSQLSVPDEQYTDASPKGSVDAGIRHLIAQINAHAGLVTTSSCAGRVSVYLEGKKSAGAGAEGKEPAADDGERDMLLDVGGDGSQQQRGGNGNAASSAGGKGGGEWLFVSHDPVPGSEGHEGYESLLGLGARLAERETGQDVDADSAGSPRLIHFKFEPMVCSRITCS
jgi:tRNA wybutosine-synthesizing protein 3